MKVSIVIPVINEENLINDTIDHLRRISAGSPVEIIVVDGDGTGSTISKIADEGVIRIVSPPGRAVQMNRGAEHATGDILLFIHADTRLPAGAVGRVREAVRAGRYAAGAFGLGLDSDRLSMRIIAAAARLRIRISGIPFGDQALFMARDYFHAIGGYAELPLMEDVELAARIKKRGDAIVILPDRVSTSIRKWERDGILFSIFRNWFIQLAYVCGASPDWLAKVYYRGR